MLSKFIEVKDGLRRRYINLDAIVEIRPIDSNSRGSCFNVMGSADLCYSILSSEELIERIDRWHNSMNPNEG